jgi:hypothetical protein
VKARVSRKDILYLLPRGDLLVGPDARDVKVDARSFVGDNSTFADEEGSRYARTCGIVLDGETSANVFAVTPESGQGRHNHSAGE